MAETTGASLISPFSLGKRAAESFVSSWSSSLSLIVSASAGPKMRPANIDGNIHL